MEHFEIFLGALFISVALLNSVANWLQIPYPIVLVLGGLGLGLMPGMPEIELDPELVLLVFLPPLLYSAAFFSDLHALRADLRSISMAAIGLVLLTMVLVAVVAHHALDMPWPMAFTLGAILAPTDPIAATTILRRLGAPRRIVNIVEGESLINDATALVAYKMALAVVVGGSFSALDAGMEFVVSAAGGIAVGLVVGKVITEIRRRLHDVTTEITISLFTAYGAFIPADELGCSGVLAAVTAGIFIGWRAPQIASPQMRLQGYSVWEVLVFLLNATLFILIGLQLPVVLEGIDGYTTSELLWGAVVVSLTVTGARFVFAFTMPYVIRALDRRPEQRLRRVGWRPRVVNAWSGMRGAVSLAAALALPLETDAGAPLPDRDLVLFLTFSVIVVTVVGQGLTLPALIRKMGIAEDGSEEAEEEARGRAAASAAAIARLNQLADEDWTNDDTIERLRGLHTFRERRFLARIDGELGDGEADGIEERSQSYQRLLREIYGAQREALLELRSAGAISNDVMRRIEHDLDLEEARIA
ncbi:MAG: Na+/H+ antiporter [Solirubrobacteraceae bacterium]|nr:Na+/H+ antiporter [Solirubrobacteraceae bacterium]